MARKARVMVTLKCNRKCDGCCNTGEVFDNHTVIKSLEEVTNYDEILITGGEPMLLGADLVDMVRDLRAGGYRGIVYLYTAMHSHYLLQLLALELIDGIHFTLHYECSDDDVLKLKYLSESLADSCVSTRLAIDSRLYDRYDFDNIRLRAWDIVRKLEWKKDCPLPEGEELFLLEA